MRKFTGLSSGWSMHRWALVLSALALAPALKQGLAQASGEVRRPRGVYAYGFGPGYPPLYAGLLTNPAVSGLAIGVTWGQLNPNPPSSPQAYDWSYLDQAFADVAQWNAANPSQAPKTIMISLNSGFAAPKWVKDQIPSCDGLFTSPSQIPPSNCGKATFLGFSEGGGGVLPMPWNAFYKSSFRTFLRAFAERYRSNPAFVSMDVSGPTAASTEMILPNDVNTPHQAQFGGIPAGAMWLKLLAFAYPNKPAYQNSDQAFIDEWDAAIDMFGEIFSGVTLTTWTGDGLFNFSDKGFTVPSAFTGDCPNPNMDCAAETTILSHFVDPSVAAAGGKATGEAGMNGLRLPFRINLGDYAAKLLSQRTEQFTSPAAQILGGQQFGQPVSLTPVRQGCTAPFPPLDPPPAGCTIDHKTCTTFECIPVTCIPQACLAPGITQADLAGYVTFGNVPKEELIPPEQAAYNILRNYFEGTPVASFFGGTPGLAPENYVQIYVEDINYATNHVNIPKEVVQADGTVVSETMQDLLNLASQKLLEIAEDAPVITAVNGLLAGNSPISTNELVVIKGANLGPSGYSLFWDILGLLHNSMPTQLQGVTATVNGKSAFIYYVSPEELIILTPPGGTSGPVPVQVTTNGSTSAIFTAQSR